MELKEIPERMLLMGGGIIGLEMGMVYQALGSQVEVVEMLDQVIPRSRRGCDQGVHTRHPQDLPVSARNQSDGRGGSRQRLGVTFESKDGSIATEEYDAVLVAIGRTPNGTLIDAGKAGVEVDDHGYIPVDARLRTNVPHIYAVGDVIGQPMLAHKGVHEGHVAAEVIAGEDRTFQPEAIPSIAYTDPEVAWVGKTEKEAQAAGLDYETSTFPWAASGRAVASAAPIGMTKLIWDKATGPVGRGHGGLQCR